MPLSLPFNASRSQVTRFVAKLRRANYNGIIVEMISANTGHPMNDATWKALAEACERERLFLVVDEALTAVRRGAALACLLPDYIAHRPSFVLPAAIMDSLAVLMQIRDRRLTEMASRIGDNLRDVIRTYCGPDTQSQGLGYGCQRRP